MEQERLYWFAAITRARQERAIKTRLTELGIECFVPVRTEIRQWSDRRRKVEVPVVPNLVFLRATRERAFELAGAIGYTLRYMRNLETGKVLVIPDKQMADFIFLMGFDDDRVEVDTTMERGDRVRILRGDFRDVEGELIRVDGRTKVVVRLEGIAALAVEIARSSVEKIDARQHCIV